MVDPEALSRDELIAVVRDQAAQLADQTAEVERLRAELEQIKRLISRNSRNSSMPPSTDDLPGRSGRSKPAGGGRSGGKKPGRGKQPGAPGSYLPWLDEADVRVVDQRPCGPCECGTDLAGAVDEGVVSASQVTDVPLVTASTVEYRQYRVRCGCGRKHVAAPPKQAGVGNTRVYGANLRALAVYLLIVQHVPVERCVRLIADLAGTRVSAGFVHKVLAAVAAAVTDIVTMIKALITLAEVVHFDETTIRAGAAGRNGYVWSASTGRYTLYALAERRSGEQFRTIGIGPAFTGVAVHDRYTVYDQAGNFADGVRHQLCRAHLLRDLEDAAETYPDHVWPVQCQRALRGLIHAANLARAAGQAEIDPAVRDPLVREFRDGVIVGRKDVPRVGGPRDRQPPGRNLLEDLHHRHDDVLRFCYDTTIPPTNNLAERDLRPNKTQQKISGRLTSEKATRDRLTIRSYLSTAVKHGVNAMTALRDAVTGNPWMPQTAHILQG
ncbi:IS66 family transposase [Solwaraspora sp. WMMA2080]|uniref:IS66 family transposase n=1 Tax=unclassified Solwaraspora TaxID=2627926 RepID=UPI00248CFCE1|nr:MULTISPECIES: IS66 family transposase [unclassified Solwaraspora]WBB95527.1 IS66 family transposase [Solwaraspora sp. WMMA2059]WBC20568.1 IS66 family transposase [Solwaraspora sp. WMMA2080]